MDIKNKMEKFNKRWNINTSDSPGVAFGKFKTRILNIFNDIDDHLTESSIASFCQFYGIKEVWSPGGFDSRYSKNVINRLTQEGDIKEFCKIIELIFSLEIHEIWDARHKVVYGKDVLFSKVEEALNLSSVEVSIAIANSEVILFPKGEEMLDNQLVNSPLSFLDTKSNEHFIQALASYQDKKYIKSAESLRRSIEEYLRFKLKNNKGLTGNIEELNKILKSQKNDPQVRNIVSQTFNILDQYFNENSKHNDGDIDDVEDEFLIYQVGLVLRYVSKIVI